MGDVDDTKRVVLTVEEGSALATIAKSFALPERLGDNTYTVGDRSIATTDEVGALRRALREQSPLMQGAERWNCFGPQECWRQIKNEVGSIGFQVLKPKEEAAIRVDDNVLGGISWCLLVGLHPSSSVCRPLDIQQDVLWPIAKKVGLVHQLRELIGITAKVQPRRWKRDGEYESADKSALKG